MDIPFSTFAIGTLNIIIHYICCPLHLVSVMESYTKEFETLKGMRTLNWLEALGDVELDIELEDGSKTFNVNPVQATIIMLFEEKGKQVLKIFFKYMQNYNLKNYTNTTGMISWGANDNDYPKDFCLLKSLLVEFR